MVARTPGPMGATIEIEDADGHREQVKVLLTHMGPSH
jgi:hypothetical protein